MHENKILDAIESLTLGTLTDDEKSLILADITFSLQGKRTASNLNDLILTKISDLNKGLYKQSQIMNSYYQDFSENESYPKAFEMINKDEIDKFLNKMSSKNFEGNYFDDTWNFYHPIENLYSDGVAKHRSDFNVK